MAEWIVQFIEERGYFAIALLMLAENLFPPLPSELIMPFAGYAASRGELQPVGVVLAGALGSLLGALFWFGVGHWVGGERLRRWVGRHGRWLTLTPQDVEKADAWFDRRGHLAVFIGRMVPAVRTLISVPAGLAGMGLMPFVAWTAAGSLLWCSILTAAGFALGQKYETASGTLNIATGCTLAILVAWYLWRVATFHRRD